MAYYVISQNVHSLLTDYSLRLVEAMAVQGGKTVETEFVICYSAPVRRDGEIVGVLSIEKNGYRFSKLIEGIQFIDTGGSYIINAEGTDIAVSDPAHIGWVTTQYNAQKLLEEKMDEETKSILELEKKGMRGETGLGTYYWEEGLCYVFYKPIPSVNWVLLTGMLNRNTFPGSRNSAITPSWKSSWTVNAHRNLFTRKQTATG